MLNISLYTERLFKKGEKRKRMTVQLAKLVGAVADKIAESVPTGTEVSVNGKTYEVITKFSNLGGKRFLAVKVWHSEYGDYSYRVITDRPPGTSFYLHGDFHVKVFTAERNEYLHFANHLQEVIKAFEAKEDEVIETLRRAFDELRQTAEAETEE